MDGKRKYTVSAKVLAANRRNLAKANAVPKEIRFRSTPRRTAAARQNLLRACAARRPASLPAHRSWSCRAVWRALRRWGEEELKWFRTLAELMERMVDPHPSDRCEQKLARGMGEALWRRVEVLHERAEREREGLRRVWSERLSGESGDALSAARLGARLLGVLRTPAWFKEAIERIELRLNRLARLWHGSHVDNDYELREEIERAPVGPLGNPFQAMPSEWIAEQLSQPAPEFYFGKRPMAGFPAEEPLATRPPRQSRQPLAQTCCSKSAAFLAPKTKTAELKDNSALRPQSKIQNRKSKIAKELPEWPASFKGYRRLVKRALAAPAEFAPLVEPLIERIARLSWERWCVIELEWQRVRENLEWPMRWAGRGNWACRAVETALEAIAGEDDEWETAKAQALELEAELAEAFREYLEKRYGPQGPGIGNRDSSGGDDITLHVVGTPSARAGRIHQKQCMRHPADLLFKVCGLFHAQTKSRGVQEQLRATPSPGIGIRGRRKKMARCDVSFKPRKKSVTFDGFTRHLNFDTIRAG